MPSTRHFARVLVVQSVFEWQQRHETKQPLSLKKIAERSLAKFDFELNNKRFIEKLAAGIEKHNEEIEKIITLAAPEWPLPQVAQVDQAVLRVAIFELLFDNEVPPKAVINEAVEIAKAFGGESSPKFVNGVLGTVYRNSEKYKKEPQEAESRKPKQKQNVKTGQNGKKQENDQK